MTERSKEELIEILDNIIYWDSCPELYKEKIPDLITEIKALTIPVVVKSFCKHCNNELCDSQTFNSTCFNCGKKPI